MTAKQVTKGGGGYHAILELSCTLPCHRRIFNFIHFIVDFFGKKIFGVGKQKIDKKITIAICNQGHMQDFSGGGGPT